MHNNNNSGNSFSPRRSEVVSRNARTSFSEFPSDFERGIRSKHLTSTRTKKLPGKNSNIITLRSIQTKLITFLTIALVYFLGKKRSRLLLWCVSVVNSYNRLHCDAVFALHINLCACLHPSFTCQLPVKSSIRGKLEELQRKLFFYHFLYYRIH